jgi:hypothetical protein
MTQPQNHATFLVDLRCESAAYEGELHELAADLEERLRAAFGPEHVTVGRLTGHGNRLTNDGRSG